MSRTRELLRDLHAMVVKAVYLADPGHDGDDAIDIADRMIVEHLTDAPGPENSGTGWASVRVQFPKTNYHSRVLAIQTLVNSGLSHRTVARLFNIDRSTVTKICRDSPDDM